MIAFTLEEVGRQRAACIIELVVLYREDADAPSWHASAVAKLSYLITHGRRQPSVTPVGERATPFLPFAVMIKQAVAAPGLAILYTGVVDALTRSGRFSALDVVAPGMPVCHALRRGCVRVTHL